MGATRKRSVRDHYDKLGGSVYDAQYGEEQPAKYRLALGLVPIPTKALILDDGCGTGTFLDGLGEWAVGLDLSGSLLSAAMERPDRRLNLVQGDAEALPFRGSVFGGVYSFTLIQNTPDPAVALSEMARVTHGSGWIVVTALRKVFTREDFEGIMMTQAWAEFHLSDGDPHDLVAYARVKAWDG